jgi:hypothetical protein
MARVPTKKMADMSGLFFVNAEMSLYKQLEKPIPARFHAAYLHEKQKSYPPGHRVRFALQHFVLFCFVTAAQGVIGNASYAAVSRLIKRIREPKTELLPSKTTFEAVVSRKIYNQIRREQHPGTRADTRISTDVEETIEKTYRLTLAFKKTPPKKVRRRD